VQYLESRDLVTAFLFPSPKFSRAPYALLLTLILNGCATYATTPASTAEPFCSVNGIGVHTDFEGAALHACEQGDKGPVLTIAPEFAPINPSPWYAYQLQPAPANSAPGIITITQRYVHGQHRYRPWFRTLNGEWTLAPEATQTLSADRQYFEYQLELPPEGLQVAAQPMVSVQDTLDWSDALARSKRLKTQTLLTSSMGLRIPLYESVPQDPLGMILLLGRQHPPEVTGAFAYQDFVDRLFENDRLAREFRQRFRLALVPLVNPDGVARGHWRMNRGGTDLNRDWGLFTQPETRAIADWLDTAVQETKLSLLLDFHSTWNDVFYGQHPSDNPTPSGFNRAWYEAIKNRLGDDTPAWSGQHNPGLPTSKSWARREFGISAITYEVGDRTPRDVIRHKARISAEELMRILLSIKDPNS
jgi:hypothetical protein